MVVRGKQQHTQNREASGSVGNFVASAIPGWLIAENIGNKEKNY